MPEARVAVVTGGTRGIGLAIAGRLREDGFTVLTLARSGSDLDADVGDAASVRAAWKRLPGPAAVLVNNAGVARDGLAIRMPDEDWHDVLGTNLTGAHTCTRLALEDMLPGRWGRIVNVSSVVAERANAGQANYVAAKAGLLGYTRTVAREVARRGITVNAVSPGLIATDMTAELGPELLKQVPARRPGTPEEVADAVSFLVSDRAAYITGATLAVDGGLGA